jgi:hypothetical protein
MQGESLIPAGLDDALERIEVIRGLNAMTMTQADAIRAWHAVAYAFPGLHPDCEWEPGQPTQEFNDDKCPEWLRAANAESGWPVALHALFAYMWELYAEDEIDDETFYPSDAAHAGLLGFMLSPT